ncbi:hypothetical protein LEP1GSC173_2685 [Leptospira interrogans str. HAI1594]|uniref:Uncharacterized protein n=9 Tax=Leptospira interrogans TaxID=173 RepID=M3HII0_LEPIR|nr:hypothetical protein G436_3436 [Leptospira interrogans serovar Hardjo str. Norma]EJP04226.1 hypothetical protein LEP1GSC007_0350 [Leptospira interrogans serovar Bulgarica str. Mallika]EKO06789.1 hypothetical protein LEP1GSC077_4350 [Leptospira interrogans str. C10069]EKO25437.1 hypothetical protein LEP1GSC104_3567 [Leptospira interrogans str. UI 12621]EKO89229.1 hypothetical protein LEP1GSC009_4266 [Leptospira interrogans serovar Grippotyphosa str. Andaman]EKO96574.1 hypothetical protein LE
MDSENEKEFSKSMSSHILESICKVQILAFFREMKFLHRTHVNL